MSNVLQRILWYKNRLASMSGAELKHRADEQLKRAVSARFTPDFSDAGDIRQGLPKLPGLLDGLPALSGDQWILQEWNDIAERARSGRIKLLGVEWPGETGNGKWALDPVTGNCWPESDYCFRIPYRHAEKMGDVKYVWELNRLQYLQPVASLATITKNEELARFCANEIESWIDNNPPFNGVNWASGIELACRIVSILTVASIIGDDAFSAVQRRKIQTSLATHGYWLMRYPSRFSSANNHLIAEAGGLFLLGSLAPWFTHSTRWAEYGRNTLIREASAQIHTDGVGAEQSPTYTAFTLEWLLLCGRVAEWTGQPFPEAYWQRITLAGEFLRWITDSSGNQPRIGDDDEGRVFYSQSTSESYASSVLGCLATTTGRSELAPPTVHPHLREAFFGKTVCNPDGPSGSRYFEAGGYTVSRSCHNGTDTLFVMDHGPLGYLSIAAHGHADALAVWLHLDGQPVLVDAGTYLYHSGKEWRDHMRSTPAHNTLSVSGTDSSLISGAFNWSSRATISEHNFQSNVDGWSAEARHDGFVQRFGVWHQRYVKYASDGTFLITDSLIGSRPEYQVEIGFLVHPRLTIQGEDKTWTVFKDDRPLLEIQYQGDRLHGFIQHGSRSPLRGWYSAEFGHKVPAHRLTFEGKQPVDSASRITLRLIN